MQTTQSGTETKRCPGCGQHKVLTEFSRDRSTKSGFSVRCLECIRDDYRRILSLDKVLKDDNGRYDMLAYKDLRKPTDETWEKVIQSLAIWMDENILTAPQAEAILMHDIELLSIQEIGELVGCHYSTVRYHYQKGLSRLKGMYAQEVG